MIAGRRTTPPFRADHVGSLLRPPELLQARRRHAAGEIDDAALRRAEDAAIHAAVALQQECGLQSITDGEFRRGSWHMDFLYELGGVERDEEHRLVAHFRNADGALDFAPAGSRVTGRLRIEHTIFGDAFQFLKDAVAASGAAGTPKLTIPSPSMLHYRGGRAAIDAEAYPDLAAFWADLGDAYAEQIARLGELQCTYLQLDDTSLAYLNDPNERRGLQQRGADAEHQHETYIATINRALADRPEGMIITTHLCRGNFRSSWIAEGGYEFVAEALFGELAVDGFFLEYDDERSGGFEPLRFVPSDKLVVLGLVTSKRGELETPDTLKRRIEEASRHVDVAQICLSPQCGFSSTVDGNSLTAEQQRRKLELVVRVAEEVWG